jgi:hypothetical protein
VTAAHDVGRLGRVQLGERLGGFVYGTIVVLAVVVTGAKAYPHEPGHVAALVVMTTVVFWLAPSTRMRSPTASAARSSSRAQPSRASPGTRAR